MGDRVSAGWGFVVSFVCSLMSALCGGGRSSWLCEGHARKQGGQERRTDSFPPAAGGRGLFIRALAQPLCHHAELLGDSAFRQTFVSDDSAKWWAAPPPLRSASRRAAFEGSREGDGGEKGRQESAGEGGRGLSLSTEKEPGPPVGSLAERLQPCWPVSSLPSPNGPHFTLP